ncbi:MAG: low molecular weight phosphotyrosine protein phosphatase [Xanthomonadales bacterium]|nr:low molecular weight phosphotyrosine protein phosphatase [Xanthomonadales bacterium]
MKNILFVCMGNICRSPTAEAVFRHELAQAGIGDVALDSAGTEAYHVGQAPDRRSIATARCHGIDMSGLRARQVVADDLQRFDLLLCADEVNLSALHRRFGDGGRAERRLLLPWAGIDTPREVPDPYYDGREAFDAVFELLQHAAQRLCNRLRGPA